MSNQYQVGQENNSDGTLIITVYKNGEKVNTWFQGIREPAKHFYDTVNAIISNHTAGEIKKLPFGF